MTVTEFIVAAAILVTLMSMAMGGYLHLVRNEKRSSEVAQLDMDVRKAIELLREGLRLTTIDELVFYPPADPPYQAMSFPSVVDLNEDGLVDLNAGGTNVLWGQTVIYHIWQGSPYQLLRTTFQPRNLALTDEERAEQLRRVVEQNDHGADYELETYQGTTRIFSNFFEWQLTSKSTAFDAYSPVEGRETVSFGSYVLTPGEHTLTFRITDKNSQNTTDSYRLAIDTLRPTLSGGEIEAEALTVSAATPASSVRTTIPGVCSGNNYLDFPATDLNQMMTLTFRNDEWVESNFQAAGVRHSNTVSQAIGTRLDYAVTLGGVGDAWTAERRSRGAIGSWQSLPYGAGGVLVRVPIEGVDIADAGPLVLSGALRRVPSADSSSASRTEANHCLELVVYDASWNATVDDYAVIAEVDAAMQIVSGTARNIYLRRWGSGYYIYGWYVGTGTYEISAAKRYVLSFWLKPTSEYFPWYYVGTWQHPADTLAPATQIHLQATNNTTLARAALAASWPAGTYTNLTKVAGVERLITSYAPAGEFLSQVYDTGFADPTFENLTYTNDTPSGTSLSLWLRSGDTPNLDGVVWSPVLSGEAPFLQTFGRYVQFRARLTSDINSSLTPALRRLRLQWDAPLAMVDLSGVLYKGPDRGAFEVLVDGKPLVRSVRVELTLFRDVSTINYKTERLTSAMVAEVEPRNTGR